MSTLRPLSPQHLPALEALLVLARSTALPGLRWHLHTPYATGLGLFAADELMAVGTALQLGGMARITHVILHPQLPAHAVRSFRGTLVQHLLALGATAVEVQVDEASAAPWTELGFEPGHAFVRYHAGTHLDAQRDEVLLLEPAHTLALLHLDQRATGHDRRALLLEHRFVAHVYVEAGRVRGGLLPLLGHGLIVADADHTGLELQRWLLPHQAHLVLPAENTAACAHLHERGYHPTPAGRRHVLGAAPAFRPELVYAWPWMQL